MASEIATDESVLITDCESIPSSEQQSTKVTTSSFMFYDKNTEYTALLPSSKTHGLTWQLACLFVVGEILGGGVVAMADGVANTGWVAGITIMFINMIANCYLATMQAKCVILILQREPTFQDRIRDPYTAMVDFALGKKMKLFARVLLCFLTLAVTTVYLLLSSELTITFLGIIFPKLKTIFSVRIWLTFFALVLIPLTLFGTPKDFWGIALLASLSTFVAILLVLIQLWLHIPDIKTVQERHVTTSTFFFGCGTIVFGFAGLPYLPNIQIDMKNQKKFPRVVYASFLFVGFTYLTVAISGMAILGNDLNGNIVLNAVELTEVEYGQLVVPYKCLSYTALVLLAGHFICGYVLIFNNIAQEVEEYFQIPRNFNWRRCLIRSSLVSLTLILGQTIPAFNIILSFAGGILFTILSYHIIPLVYWKLEPNSSLLTKVISIILFIYGFIVACGSLYSNIQHLIILYSKQ